MDKVKKIALILLIWLQTIFFISVVQFRPIQISLTMGSFFQIPIIYWIILLASPFLLYIIAKDSKNPLVPIACVILYYFLFYSIGIYFMSHPTFTDVGRTTQFHEILSSITHVNPKIIDSETYISTARYFQWPVYFIFSKIFSLVLGIGVISTMNLGFFSLLLVLPALLPLFYKKVGNVKNITLYFIFPALYLALSWHFINDQFVPQFLALIYLFIVFGLYNIYSKNKNKLFLLLMIIFYALTVFTHAFIYIFFLVAIFVEIFWSEYVVMKKSKVITYGLLIIFLAILFPYIGTYYSMAGTSTGAESWRIFQYFSSGRDVNGGGPVGPQIQILYHLVPQIYDQLMSNIVKVVMAGSLAVVVIGLILYLLKKGSLFKMDKRTLFDISILIGSASWFALGLAKMVLGQRALQVATLPLVRYFKYPHKLFSYVSKILVVVILISPALFIANDLINLSIRGEIFIQDNEENIAGRFIDKHFTNGSSILLAQNAYPCGYPTPVWKVSASTNINRMYNEGLLEFYLDSPKLQKILSFYNKKIPEDPYDSVLYDNEDIKIGNFGKQR